MQINTATAIEKQLSQRLSIGITNSLVVLTFEIM